MNEQIRIAKESYIQSQEIIEELALKYDYPPWRVRVMDAQRASVNFVNSLKISESKLNSATMLNQANGYSFTTAHNSSLNDKNAKIVTPYSITVDGVDDNVPLRKRSAQLLYENEPIIAFDSFRLYDIMSAVSLWYFERRQYDGTPLPEKVFVNPALGCSLRCKSCSRIKFLNKPMEYETNINDIVNQISSQIKEKDDLKVVNISTGTFASVEEDYNLFIDIIECFRRKGFVKARFSIQSSTKFNIEQLSNFRKLGVDRYSVTMDGTSDNVLNSIYRGKGYNSIDGYSDFIKKMEDIFPKVGVHIILGHDSKDQIKRVTERLANQGKAALHHYIPRIFIPSQYNILNSEAIEEGLKYYVELKRFIDDLNDARMEKIDLLNPFYGLKANEFVDQT